MNKKEVRNLVVVENIALNTTNFLIKLRSPEQLPTLKPGQFVNIEIKNTSEIFLRRPFSVFEVDYLQNTISLIVKILGRGSKKLTESLIGESISVIYPLGKSFTYPNKNDCVLLIGGGSGIAPMLFLAKESGLNRDNISLLLGARSSADHINVDNYFQYGNLHFTTEDGSLGEKGFVTQHSVFQNNINNFDKIYACGPVAMMKAIAKEAKKANVFCEVSLENLMACGFGVCLCCIEPTIKGNLCVCTEGPVFNTNDLKW
ncbi:MAG TPA: dihydroorotate dehydrogenase electron transfer subunit [Draconibacterium sp.]|nr:dihydroorotate dehydrogenase electron transfer subunit [Draconibacterium sp.]